VNVVADALSRKELVRPLRVRAIVMTINPNLASQIRDARIKSLKKENVKDENLRDAPRLEENALLAKYENRHRHLYQQVLDEFKSEGRLPEAIWFSSTTRNTPMEMGKDNHRFYHKATQDNKQLRHDLGNHDRQKNYADVRRKPLKFQVGDKVMLKVSSWKGVIRFGKREKLNPCYVGPFRILAKVGTRLWTRTSRTNE
ncbi:hypothetical protein Tco_1451202, partial [Tanacetum coccineum]